MIFQFEKINKITLSKTTKLNSSNLRSLKKTKDDKNQIKECFVKLIWMTKKLYSKSDEFKTLKCQFEYKWKKANYRWPDTAFKQQNFQYYSEK